MNSKNNSSSNNGEPIPPSKLCPKNMTGNDNAILYDLCQTRVHIKCNHLNYMDHKYLQGCNKPWCCLSCNNTLLPFGNLNNENFLDFIGNNNNTITSSETKNLNSSVLLKPTPDLALLFNQFNNAVPENRSDPENIIQSKYYDRDELQKLKFLIRRTLYLYFTSFLVH